MEFCSTFSILSGLVSIKDPISTVQVNAAQRRNKSHWGQGLGIKSYNWLSETELWHRRKSAPTLQKSIMRTTELNF